MSATENGWEVYADGFAKGNIAVFPALDSWEVWEKVSGEWEPVCPPLFITRKWSDHVPDRDPPYGHYSRTRLECIIAAQAAAEIYKETK